MVRGSTEDAKAPTLDRRSLPVLLAAALVALALLAPAAQAKQQRIFDGAFAASIAANPYPLGKAWSVAVDTSPASSSKGDIYVSDPENHRVEKLDSEGHFILMFGKEVNKTKTEEGKPEAERNVCTLSSGDECKAGLAGTSPGAYASSVYLYVAVDSSSGSSAGDVYVADGSGGKVTKLDPSGGVISSWGTNGQMDGSGISPGPAGPLSGPFGTLNGVAVDPSGNLWVYGTEPPNNPALFEFSQGGSLMTDSGGEPGSFYYHFYGVGPNGLAVTPEDGLYTSLESNVILKWSAGAGTQLGFVFSGYTELGKPRDSGSGGFAFDPSTNDLYVDVVGHREQLRRFSSSCQLQVIGCLPAKETFESPHLSPISSSLAIDSAASTDTIYATGGKATRLDAYSVETVPGPTATSPTDLTHTSATLNGTVDPAGIELLGGLEGCRFEWGETEAPYEHVAACDKSAAQIGSGEGPVEVSAPISGLQAGHIYHFRLVAANQNDGNPLTDEPSQSADVAFGPPSIESTYATAVSATEATLGADVNPRGSARVRFEYGTQAGVYEHATEEIDVSGATVKALSAEIAGLSPHTVYHYRAVAENPFAEGPEAVLGPDRTLTTQPTAPFSLLDSRGWEMVSPPNKHGALLQPIAAGGVSQAAADGSAIAYLASGPTEAEPAGYTNQAQVLSGRGSGGWSSHDIAPPHGAPSGLSIGEGQEYRAFSTDLTHALLQPFGGYLALSPQSTETTPYLRTDFAAGEPTSFCTAECYRPLATAAEGVADVKPGVEFGLNDGGLSCPPSFPFCGPTFLGATPDLSHVVLQYIRDGLTTTPEDAGGLYEWSSAAAPTEALKLVSILPTNKPAPGTEVMLGSAHGVNVRDAISADGSRIVWSFNGERLYLRDTTLGQTVRLDTKHGGSGEGRPTPLLQGASSDGSRVFFTDEQALTPDSGAGESPDLYECAIAVEAGKLKCTLADLTPKAGEESADVLGEVLGASEDGSYIYLAANGVLAHNKNAAGEEAASGDCQGNESGSRPNATCNLYLLHEGTTTFISTLSGLDNPDWGRFLELTMLTARVSPNGRWLAFMSQRPLTGYDNRDVASGQRDEEVFLYHAGAEGEEGKLVCASCDPSGARPHGVEYRQIEFEEAGLAGGANIWPQDTWIAANVPGWTPYKNNGHALYQSRYLSSQGRLFFNAADSLVAADSNGTEDVYEYEPPQGAETSESDSCEESSPTYTPAAAGCVDLISSGTSGEESAFLDASETGDDVFFLSSAHLSPRDEDSAVDLYDARVGGGEEEEAKPVECIGDACQQPATPPNDATPGSLSYSGPGNVSEGPSAPRCAKGKVKRKGACVAKKPHHRHPKKHKRRAGHGRRAGR
jgi:hypothetical protein